MWLRPKITLATHANSLKTEECLIQSCLEALQWKLMLTTSKYLTPFRMCVLCLTTKMKRALPWWRASLTSLTPQWTKGSNHRPRPFYTKICKVQLTEGIVLWMVAQVPATSSRLKQRSWIVWSGLGSRTIRSSSTNPKTWSKSSHTCSLSRTTQMQPGITKEELVKLTSTSSPNTGPGCSLKGAW